MFPVFNSLPFHSNGATPSSAPQQVMGNPGNFAPQPMQIPPQMGLFNPQTVFPFNNSNSQFFPFQAPQSFNNRIAMNQMNSITAPQPMPQFFTQNTLNPSQFLNQNLNMGFPNQIQSMNQFFPMQGSNLNNQVVPGSFNLPQNLRFVGKMPLGSGNSGGVMQHTVVPNQTPTAIQQLQGVQAFASPQRNLNNVRPLPVKSQGNDRNPMVNHNVNHNRKNPRQKNFVRNSKREASQSRFKKSQSHDMQNSNGNFKPPSHMQLRKGNGNVEGRKSFVDDSAKQPQVQKKRLIPLMYTEQEVQQWREERKKNYPSKANMEKKLTQKLKQPEASDDVAKLRRQQLKQILAKQAELGCEVAEIPACYLSDSEQQVHGRKQNGRPFGRKEKFQNKFNKRGRFNQNDGFFKKKGSVNHGSSDTYSQNDHVVKKQRLAKGDSIHDASKREPTLLQKLLSADIRRDKRHLLQAFRFMVLNSFFKDWPEKSLKFPVLIVKETGDEGELIMEGTSNGGNEVVLNESEELIDEYENSKIKTNGQDQDVDSGGEKYCVEGRETQEEEGEIID